MGSIKHYLNNVICACVPDEQFGQDAVEYAVTMGLVKLTYALEADVAAIMADYDAIAQAYRTEVIASRAVHLSSVLTRNESLLVETYGPLLADTARAA